MLRQLTGVACLFGLLACSGADVESTSVAHESLEVLRGGVPDLRATARASIDRSTSRLCDLAADRFGDPARNGLSDDDPDDGGWDWLLAPTSSSHSVEPSPENLYGAVGLAPWAGLRLGLSPLRNRATLYNAYWGALSNPNVDSPPDFVFLSLLSDVFPRGPLELARDRYDAKLSAAGGAAALADSIREAHRAGASDGLFAYDLAWLALGAAALDVKFPRANYGADYRTYIAAVVDDLGSPTALFDVTDAREPYYTQGLAWSLLVLSWAHGVHATYDDVRSRLLASQLASGAFPYNADFPAGHLQATAHALMALALIHHGHAAPRAVSDAAADWLLAAQSDNGGFAYSASEEYPLLDAEIALALYLSETTPGSRSGLRPRGPAHVAFALTSESSLPPLAAPLSAP